MRYPTLSKVCTQYGAPMGRYNTIEEPNAQIKFHLYKMPMSSCGCYDNGGAYWGAGDHKIGFMYHAYGCGPKFKNEMFVRAKNREDAKAQVKKLFKNSRFFR